VTGGEAELLVFMDERGDYYLLARETMDHARVPEGQRALVEALLRGGVSGLLHRALMFSRREQRRHHFTFVGTIPPDAGRARGSMTDTGTR
jgi:hypothetical protein